MARGACSHSVSASWCSRKTAAAVQAPRLQHQTDTQTDRKFGLMADDFSARFTVGVQAPARPPQQPHSGPAVVLCDGRRRRRPARRARPRAPVRGCGQWSRAPAPRAPLATPPRMRPLPYGQFYSWCRYHAAGTPRTRETTFVRPASATAHTHTLTQPQRATLSLLPRPTSLVAPRARARARHKSRVRTYSSSD